jgi:transposase-like protein
MGLRCKRCGAEEHVKNGLMRGKQRYRCKACGLNFTDTPPRGMPLATKVTAVLLYVSGLSMNRTAKLLGVSTPTVMAWIERFAEVYARSPSRRAAPSWSSWTRCGTTSKKAEQALGLEGSGSCFGASG